MSILSVLAAPFKWAAKTEREIVADVVADFHGVVLRLDTIAADIEHEMQAIDKEVLKLLGRKSTIMKDHTEATMIADRVHEAVTAPTTPAAPVAPVVSQFVGTFAPQGSQALQDQVVPPGPEAAQAAPVAPVPTPDA